MVNSAGLGQRTFVRDYLAFRIAMDGLGAEMEAGASGAVDFQVPAGAGSTSEVFCRLEIDLIASFS